MGKREWEQKFFLGDGNREWESEKVVPVGHYLQDCRYLHRAGYADLWICHRIDDEVLWILP
jgi:hypothetical protein